MGTADWPMPNGRLRQGPLCQPQGARAAGSRRTLVPELYYGSFAPPHEVGGKGSTAWLDKGMLTLRLPRSAGSASRTLKTD